MRLIGILIVLAVIAYISCNYIKPVSSDSVSTPAEYIEQAKQSTDKINEVIKQQQEILDRVE